MGELESHKIKEQGSKLPASLFRGHARQDIMNGFTRSAPYHIADAGVSFLGAENIFGYSASEAIGREIDIIIPENLRERHGNNILK